MINFLSVIKNSHFLFFTLFTLLVMSCKKDYTSVKLESLDFSSETYKLDESNPQELFSTTQKIIEKKCLSCHSSEAGHLLSFESLSEKDFVDKNFVYPGSLDKSPLIYRLKKHTVDNGLRDMPLGSNNLSDQEYRILTKWVNSLSQNLVSTNQFTCDPKKQSPKQLNLKRLSYLEYSNAVRSVFDLAYAESNLTEKFLNKINISSYIPKDSASLYTNGDSNISIQHARAYFQIADAILNEFDLSQQTNFKDKYFDLFVKKYISLDQKNCIFSSSAFLKEACRSVFIRNLVLRAWGRPIIDSDPESKAEFDALMKENDPTASNQSEFVKGVLFRVLTSPYFFSHFYNDIQLVEGETTKYKLSSYAIARRLSFMYTKTIPSEDLLKLAASADLSKKEGINQALQIIFDGKSNNKMLDQFVSEWLHLDKLPVLSDSNNEKFKLISSGLVIDESLRDAFKNELLDLVKYVSNQKKNFKEILTTNVSFAKHPSLMKIYNQVVPAPDEINDDNAVRFKDNERSGLLTRAGMLYSGSHSENPVIRGVHIKKYILCTPISDPPASLSDVLGTPVLDPFLTTRERYAKKTSQPACVGCHSKINPIGFAFSQYNALGALQTEEPIFDEQGVFLKNIETNAKVSLSVALSVDVQTQNAMEFSAAVANSRQFKKCLTQNYYSYAFNYEDLVTKTESCEMKEMYESLNSNSTLEDFFKSAANHEHFAYRTLIKPMD